MFKYKFTLKIPIIEDREYKGTMVQTGTVMLTWYQFLIVFFRPLRLHLPCLMLLWGVPFTMWYSFKIIPMILFLLSVAILGFFVGKRVDEENLPIRILRGHENFREIEKMQEEAIAEYVVGELMRIMSEDAENDE